METIVVKDSSELEAAVDKVCKTHQPVTVSKPNGDEVKVIPVPKPIGYRKGVPIYRDEDLQYLFLEYPHWFE